ncbi:MAG: tetratricopeptide repeat protein [Lentimicrobiaceae bacterium]|nr:tetratricopeptide repeat protein [Lentimicrobiaceae bacterium]
MDELAAVRKGNTTYQQAEKLRAEAMQLIEKGGEVNTRLANEKFKEAVKLYQDAEISYRKGMATTKNFPKSNYNLANSLYRQEKYEDAANSYKYVAEQKENDRSLRAKAYHNYGNSLLKQEKYKESIEAYKDALKLNPRDLDTKYNLEYARKKMMQQQQEQNQDNKDNKDDKDKDNEDQQQQNQDNQDNKDEQNKEQDKQQQQQQRQQQQQDKRQLDALQQNERQTQKKVAEEEMKKGGKSKQEKDW